MAFKKKLLWIGGLTGSAVLAAFLSLEGLYQYSKRYPEPRIKRGNIENILYEGTKFYDSQNNLLGIFAKKNGEAEFREYVSIDKVPAICLEALVAAEDARFFKHRYGLNFKGLARAAYQNLKAGKIVQGGSSLSQQAAENLFRDYFQELKKKGQFRAKLREFYYAFQLEANYSKKEILEFLLNNYYVGYWGGTVHGISQAAHYFFNKPLADLKEIENIALVAFLKGPAKYTPFLLKEAGERDEDFQKRQEQNKKRREARLDYVLRRMLEEGFIEGNKYQELKNNLKSTEFSTSSLTGGVGGVENSGSQEEPTRALKGRASHRSVTGGGRFLFDNLKFDKGQLPSQRNSLLELAWKEIQSGEVGRELEKAGYQKENLGSANLKVILTIEPSLQAMMEYEVRRQASEISVWLGGYQKPEGEITKVVKPKLHSFYYGRIEEVQVDSLGVDFGHARGVVDKKGLERMVKLQDKYLGKEWGKFKRGELKNFLKNFKVGELVYGSVRELDGEKVFLDLEQAPQLEGGALFLDHKGGILALLGSYDNQDFNYVVEGKRQPGSAFKPFILYTALQLGGHILDDELVNKEGTVFPDFKGREVEEYIPKNHHRGLEKVNPWRAMVKSENIAHVSLLYHLLDKLNEEQLKEAARQVGLGQREGETSEDYKKRMRDEEGLMFNDFYKEWFYFELAKDSLKKDFPEMKGLSYLDYMDFPKKVEKVEGLLDKLKQGLIVFPLPAFAWQEDKLIFDLEKKAESLKDLEKLIQTPREKIFIRDLPLSLGQEIKTKTDSLKERFKEKGEELYTLDYLIHEPRFRLLMAERYVKKVVQTLGIEAELPERPSLALGAGEVSLKELVGAYAALFNGLKDKPYIIKEIKNDSLIYQAQPEGEQVPYSPELVQTLYGVTHFGTASFLSKLNTWTGGKTGTTNDFKDAWFIGAFPGEKGLVTGGIWFGEYNKGSMVHQGTKIYGATAGRTFKKILESYLPEKNLEGFTLDFSRGEGEKIWIYVDNGQRVNPGECLVFEEPKNPHCVDLMTQEEKRITYIYLKKKQ